jgi:uncharacterized membrane protein (DUF2068 family)
MPFTIKIARWLFILNAAIWLAFGLYTLVRMSGEGWGSPIAMVVIAILMAGNAGLMFLIGVCLKGVKQWAYYLAIAVLIVNIILTFTDQFGLLDLATLLLDLVILTLLLAARVEYSKIAKES